MHPQLHLCELCGENRHVHNAFLLCKVALYVTQTCKAKEQRLKVLCYGVCRDHINVADVRPDLQVTRSKVVSQRKAVETAYRTLATPMHSVQRREMAPSHAR